MRRVPKPQPEHEPAGLRGYREANQNATWRQFCDEQRSARSELANFLANTQHGLCAYCEINIVNAAPFQVEHFFPKSGDRSRSLDFSNLLACCTGGVSKIHERPEIKTYRFHYASNSESSTSCGQAKDDLEPSAAGVLDPRTLPLIPRLVSLQESTGALVVDHAACAAAGISADVLVKTLEILKLNCPRLREARQTVLNELDSELIERVGVEVVGVDDDLLSRYLAPRHDGFLDSFWTVRRCLFDRRAEDWIERNKHLLW